MKRIHRPEIGVMRISYIQTQTCPKNKIRDCDVSSVLFLYYSIENYFIGELIIPCKKNDSKIQSVKQFLAFKLVIPKATSNIQKPSI